MTEHDLDSAAPHATGTDGAQRESVLYLTRNGLLEPLGQSQIWPYLRELASEHAITLISFEKASDWHDKTAMAEQQELCEDAGIEWQPHRFRAGIPLISPAIGVMQLYWYARRECRRKRHRILHARSYLPAWVGLLLRRSTGIDVLFDMRALWPEELIAAGRVGRDRVLHRWLVSLERRCLREASAVVSLTEAARRHLAAAYPAELSEQRMVVIPTCVDLHRFTPATRSPGKSPVYGCSGTLLSGWFRLGWLRQWIETVAIQDESVRFDIVTRDDMDAVREALAPLAITSDRLRIGAAKPEQMPAVLRGQDLSFMFFNAGVDKLGSSPTRMAEVLATGIPVVINAGVGDASELVANERVGVIVYEDSPTEMERAYRELMALLDEPDLGERCRRVAETHFSLDVGVSRYRALYRAVLDSADLQGVG